MWNHSSFSQKIATFENTRVWSPNLLNQFEKFIAEAEDYSLFRINPYNFAGMYGFNFEEVLDLFLYGTKSGILVMEWILICPRCGDPVNQFQKIFHVHNKYHCEFCRRDYETNLDNSIQIGFTIHPEIRTISFHNPNSLSIEEYQYKFHFSREGKVPGTSESFRTFFKIREKFLGFLEPNSRATKEIKVDVGFLEGNDFTHHSDFLIEVKPKQEGTSSVLKIEFKNGNWNVNNAEIFAGIHQIEIVNESDLRLPLSIYQLDKDFMISEFNLDFDPYLTARILLNNKTFRELFRGDDLIGATGLSIKDITILFTDLKGSTSLYERIGDLNAFALVQQHFDEINKVISKHDGILIKTIGDAIMASFLNPLNAFKAAKEMLYAIELFNARQMEREIILKIGIHSGPSIAVTLNERLDYFGQIINIAARVQGVAGGEEICFTKEIYEYPGVKEIVSDSDLHPEMVHLKGIKDPIAVYRFCY
ncbi:DUF5939 domain-containing protein [Leptospira sp. WS39.C2]